MLYYKFAVKFNLKLTKQLKRECKQEHVSLEKKLVTKFNNSLMPGVGAQNMEYLGAYNCLLSVGETNKMKHITLEVVVARKPRHGLLDKVGKFVQECVQQTFSVEKVELLRREMAPAEIKALQKKKTMTVEPKVLRGLDLPSSEENGFQNLRIKQMFCHIKQPLPLERALEDAKKLCVDQTFIEELNRIYSEENLKGCIGYPLHYVVKAPDKDTARKMAELLFVALLSNKRLLSARMDLLSKNQESFISELLLEPLIGVLKIADGAGMVIDKTYQYSELENAEIAKAINKYCTNSLIVILDYGAKGKPHGLIKALRDSRCFLEVGATAPNNQQAQEEILEIAKQDGFGDLMKEFPLTLDKQEYSQEKLQELYQNWKAERLRKDVYKAYKDLSIKKESCIDTNSAYAKLQKLIGLTSVKKVIRQLLATAHVNNERKAAGMQVGESSLHMLFTGNPGSAKTTVARLVAEILADRGIISEPKLVECGRADLVGQYVGWTAKQVQEKFEEAEGGILFIDEAYALNGTGNDFGGEAINTIVQEMENKRDKVVVIFAGYPDKMQSFLRMNEGLKSRIAYHLDFPDYNAQELYEIAELMLAEKEYSLNPEGKEQVQKQLEEIAKTKDFGNGRYVRNLLEQAMAAQALRLVDTFGEGAIPKDKLQILEAEDFVVTAPKQSQLTKKLPFGLIPA